MSFCFRSPQDDISDDGNSIANGPMASAVTQQYQESLQQEQIKYLNLQEEYSLLQTQVNESLEELKKVSEEKSKLQKSFATVKSEFDAFKADSQTKISTLESQVRYILDIDY